MPNPNESQPASSIMKTLEDTITNQPLLSVGAILCVGLAAGYVLKSGSRPPRRLDRLQRLAGTDVRSRDLERAIKRLQKTYDRNVPPAYDAVSASMAGIPDMVSALAQAWQKKAAPMVQSAVDSLPSANDVRTSVVDAATKFKK